MVEKTDKLGFVGDGTYRSANLDGMMMSRLQIIIVVVVIALLVIAFGVIGLQAGDPQPGSGSERATPETPTR